MTEQKRNVGRPPAADQEALDTILKNEKTRSEFDACIDNLVERKLGILSITESYGEDVTSVAETYKISKGWINTTVQALVKDKVEEVRGKCSSVAEYLEMRGE